MTLKLQMLGTGSAFAKTYFNNNALIYDEQYTLLVDCGVTAPQALHQMNKPFNEIDAVLITHIHADHVGGLEELAFTMKFRFQRKMKLYIAEALVDTLWENTLKGGMYQKDEIMQLSDVFDVCPLKPAMAYDITNGLRIELLPTQHIPGKDSYSIYINEHIFYSADMTFNPLLLHHLVNTRGCDVMFHECQLEGIGEVHTTLKELMSLPQSMREMIYLMHYADNKDEFVGHTAEITFLEQGKIYSF
ncbi:MBL fold metallo-hydrolase [Paenibacillus pini]|uniref:Metallo-beta-lactamase domain-containing protein n=1 Tax=Paenibacillus pini JCM 16418 TaxID=1236976 RepID=W7Y895_9BACL|nr:MBL fold metallo-hydrolase [Paenibacillus pini]GAF07135.1 hypothetical protein JCM16418_1126 [Paenibacillus pini JCM 16418]